MAQTVVSPDISVLDFSVLLDMSVAQPTISVTNLSTVISAANLKWIFEVISPSGTPIHIGDFLAPDVDGVAFTTFNVTEQLPMPFGQLEFQLNQSYSVKVSVKDSNDDIFTLTKTASICKPSGNNGKNNFGAADIHIEAKCHLGTIYITDQTNLLYKSLVGVKISTSGILSYPPNDDGTTPADFIISQMPLLAPILVGGDGYNLYVAHVYQYDLGDSFFVRVRYSYKNGKFAVWCNVDLCPLFCEYDKLLALVAANCDTVTRSEQEKKLQLINAKLLKAVVGVLQPLCGFDVPSLIEEIKEIGGFTCDCCRPQGLSNIGAVTDGNLSFAVNKLGGDAILSWSSDGAGNYTLNYSDHTYIFEICDDSDSNAFSFHQTQTGYVKTTCLKVVMLTLATEILIEIQNNQTLINLLNSILSNQGLNCPGIDPHGIYSSNCNFAVEIDASVPTDTVQSIIINGLEINAPTGTLVQQAAAIQAWLNGLTLGTWVVIFNAGTGRTTISTNGNPNTVSTITLGGSSEKIKSFSNSCGNICTILQNILDYLFQLNLFNVGVGGAMTVCSISGTGQIITTEFTAANDSYELIKAMNNAICNMAQFMAARSLSPENLRAQFAEHISTTSNPIAGDYFLMGVNGILQKMPLEKAAVGIFQLLGSDADVKNAYCQHSLCTIVAECSPVTNLAVSPGDTTAAATWSGSVGAVGYRWSVDGINYNLVTGTAATITGLNDSTTYTLRVYPVYNNGNATNCEVTLPFDTTGLGASCAEPLNFSFTNIEDDSVVINYDAVTGASGYQYRVNGGSWVNIGNVLVYKISGLSPNTTYNVAARALVGGSPCVQEAADSFDTIGSIVYVQNSFDAAGIDFVVARFTADGLNIYGGSPIQSGDTETVSIPNISVAHTYGVRVITDFAAVDTPCTMYHKRGVSTLHTKAFTALAAAANTDVTFDIAFIAVAGDVFEVVVD